MSTEPAAGDQVRPVANPIVVALDVPTLEEAVALAARLEEHVGGFKVGLELFGAHGPAAVQRVAEHGPVFLDLKLHDIPTTVGRAAERLGALGVWLLTVHAAGGAAMVRAAVEGLAVGSSRRPAHGTGVAPAVLAVTVLTSMSDDDLASVGVRPAAVQVPRLAALAVGAGAPGLVCAPHDLRAVRATVGPDVLLVTPGVRPAGARTDDHARAATPRQAVTAGADLLVVGRPITRAADPVYAAQTLLSEATG